MASSSSLLLLLLLLLLPPPARPQQDPPSCRLHWVQVGARGCQGGLAAACVGHCESRAFPSPHSVLAASRRPLSSRGLCCTMAQARKVHVTLRCPGGRGQRRLPTVSATSCRCDLCRLARY